MPWEPGWAKYIAPRFNQLVFFAVHPGETYHEVEEVLLHCNMDQEERQRITLSSWFHAAQEGDERLDEEAYRVGVQRVERLY